MKQGVKGHLNIQESYYVNCEWGSQISQFFSDFFSELNTPPHLHLQTQTPGVDIISDLHNSLIL